MLREIRVTIAVIGRMWIRQRIAASLRDWSITIFFSSLSTCLNDLNHSKFKMDRPTVLKKTLKGFQVDDFVGPGAETLSLDVWLGSSCGVVSVAFSSR